MLTAPSKMFFHCGQCRTAGRGVACNSGCGDARPVPWGPPLLLFAECGQLHYVGSHCGQGVAALSIQQRLLIWGDVFKSSLLRAVGILPCAAQGQGESSRSRRCCYRDMQAQKYTGYVQSSTPSQLCTHEIDSLVLQPVNCFTSLYVGHLLWVSLGMSVCMPFIKTEKLGESPWC